MKTWNTPEIKELHWEETMAGEMKISSAETNAQFCQQPDGIGDMADGIYYPYACALDS